MEYDIDHIVRDRDTTNLPTYKRQFHYFNTCNLNSRLHYIENDRKIKMLFGKNKILEAIDFVRNYIFVRFLIICGNTYNTS